MDTLSSSVSTLKVPTRLVPSHSRSELPHFKTYTTSSTSTFHNHLLSYPKPNNNNNKSSSISNSKPTTSLIAPQSSFRTQTAESKAVNRDPATGYAVALIESAQRHGSLERVAGDAERLLNRLGRGGERGFGDYLAEKRGFDRRLVRLVKMLVGKGDLGIVKRVLEESVRVYDEMLGTQVVLVSSPEKMSEDRIFGIAKTVQKLTGALKVKVKNFVGENYSFASV